jgi:glycosyltransferase involved in cell wall biosynthesis
METPPLVSLIIPFYNASDTLEQAIESALEQDYPELEIILSDNCSEDDSEQKALRFLTDARVRYHRHPRNIGLIGNFAAATETLARGTYVTYLCADDYLVSGGFIRKAVAAFLQHPTVSVVLSGRQTLLVAEDRLEDVAAFATGKTFMRGVDAFLHWVETTPVGWAGTLMKRDTLLSTDVFHPNNTAMDVESVLKMMVTGDVCLLPEATYVIRVHPNQSGRTAVHDLASIVKNCRWILEPIQLAALKTDIPVARLRSWKRLCLTNHLRWCALNLVLARRDADLSSLWRLTQTLYPDIYLYLRRDPRWYFWSFICRRPRFARLLQFVFPKQGMLRHIAEAVELFTARVHS